MRYTRLGRTDHTVSRLGFGSMRLPMVSIGDKEYVDAEKAIEVLHRAFELGVNYVDTGFMYCSEESEFVVGEAMDAWPRRDELVVTAKCTKFRMKNPGDMRRMLEHQLWKQRRQCFDYYLFHGVGWDNWHQIDKDTGWIADMQHAKEEGLIKHVGFSFHDKPENMIRMVDTGLFDLVTCQYNYLDRSNETAIAHAHDKGLGVVVMGPVGGGRLSVVPRSLRDAGIIGDNSAAAALALRFVLSNPGVDIAISGMGTVEMVEQNAAAVDAGPLSQDELQTVTALMDSSRELANLYCTGCQYCLPCPNEVNIPRVFEMYNYHKIYGLEDYAAEQYARLVASGHDASVCIECGTCLDRCPQHIPIPDQLAEVSAYFEALE